MSKLNEHGGVEFAGIQRQFCPVASFKAGGFLFFENVQCRPLFESAAGSERFSAKGILFPADKQPKVSYIRWHKVKRIIKVKKIMRNAELDSYFAEVKHLPQAPTTMLELIKLFQLPDRDVDSVIGLLRQNPALVADILRQSNSAVFGNDEPVKDIEEALFRMGFYEVYRLTVTLFGLQTINATKHIKGIDIDSLWKHSAITAILGEVLAKELGEPEGLVFTAGLLHDVGKVVLASAGGEKYTAVLAQHPDCGSTLVEAEKQAARVSHPEAGAWLLQRWGVPDDIAIPVLQHHDTSWSGERRRTSAIIHLANLLAHTFDQPGTAKELTGAEPAIAALELNAEKLAALKALGEAEVKRLAPTLSFQV